MIYLYEIDRKLEDKNYKALSLEECRAMMSVMPIEAAELIKELVCKYVAERCFYCDNKVYCRAYVEGSVKNVCTKHLSYYVF